jgi:hypothetical protein
MVEVVSTSKQPLLLLVNLWQRDGFRFSKPTWCWWGFWHRSDHKMLGKMK